MEFSASRLHGSRGAAVDHGDKTCDVASLDRRFWHAVSQLGRTNFAQVADDWNLPYSRARTLKREEEIHRDALCLKLRHDLKAAECYDDWQAVARQLDELEKQVTQKRRTSRAELYDVTLVKHRLDQMKAVRKSGNVGDMIWLVRTQLTRNLGGIASPSLFANRRAATDPLVEKYISTAKRVIDDILWWCEWASEGLDLKEVQVELEGALNSYGRSALLLSGGGTLGMYHIGVVKALLDRDMLPRVITGSSAGAIVSSVVCSAKDKDVMKEKLDRICYGDMSVFTGPGEEQSTSDKFMSLLNLWYDDHLFSEEHLTRVMEDLLENNLTFREAYNQTGKILNITVSSKNAYEAPQLLNHVTASNVIVWSAVVASCSVPIFFKPGKLFAKNRKGEIEDWDGSREHVDGSVEGDIPIANVAAEFNINHFIVSQTNPHVIPFLDKHEDDPRTRRMAQRAWKATAGLAKDEALHRMQMCIDEDIFTNLMSKLHSGLAQKYTGDITILPVTSYNHFNRILTNPTTAFMEDVIMTGERATWERLSLVENHLAVEVRLFKAVDELKRIIHFDETQAAGRRLEIVRRRNLTQGSDVPRRPGHITMRSVPEAIVLEGRRLFPNRFAVDPSSEDAPAFSGVDRFDSLTEDSSLSSPPAPETNLFPSLSLPPSPRRAYSTLWGRGDEDEDEEDVETASSPGDVKHDIRTSQPSVPLFLTMTPSRPGSPEAVMKPPQGSDEKRERRESHSSPSPPMSPKTVQAALAGVDGRGGMANAL